MPTTARFGRRSCTPTSGTTAPPAHQGKRFITRHCDVVCSVSRLQWVMSLPEEPLWQTAKGPEESEHAHGLADANRSVIWRDAEGSVVCDRIAYAGQIAVLEWARSQGHGWSPETCASAAWGGQLQTLQWLRDARCPWDWATCAFAAWRGHLEVLKWVRANGCPWDEETWKYAAKRGDAAVVRWLRLNGCPKKRVRWKVPLETVHVFRKETNRTSAPRGAVSSRQTPGV